MQEMSVSEAANFLGYTRDYIRWLVMKGILRKSRQIDQRTYMLEKAPIVAYGKQRQRQKA